MKKFILSVLILANLDVNAQRVGIGTTDPVAKLDIISENSPGSSSLTVRSWYGDTILWLMNSGRMGIGYNGPLGRTLNLGGNGLNIYNDNIFSGAIFGTDSSIVLGSGSNPNNCLIMQPIWGRVGIGTFSALAKLDVNGNFKLGIDGTVITHVIKVTVSKDLPMIAAGGSSTQFFAVSGAHLTGSVHASPEISLPDGLIIAYAKVSALNQVEIKFTNVSGDPINLGIIDLYITVIN